MEGFSSSFFDAWRQKHTKLQAKIIREFIQISFDDGNYKI